MNIRKQLCDLIEQAINNGDKKKAGEWIAYYKETFLPDDVSANYEAILHFSLGHFGKAWRCVEEGLAYSVQNAHLYYMAGLLYEREQLNQCAYLMYQHAAGLERQTSQTAPTSSALAEMERAAEQVRASLPVVSDFITLSFSKPAAERAASLRAALDAKTDLFFLSDALLCPAQTLFRLRLAAYEAGAPRAVTADAEYLPLPNEQAAALSFTRSLFLAHAGAFSRRSAARSPELRLPCLYLPYACLTPELLTLLETGELSAPLHASNGMPKPGSTVPLAAASPTPAVTSMALESALRVYFAEQKQPLFQINDYPVGVFAAPPAQKRPLVVDLLINRGVFLHNVIDPLCEYLHGQGHRVRVLYGDRAGLAQYPAQWAENYPLPVLLEEEGCDAFIPAARALLARIGKPDVALAVSLPFLSVVAQEIYNPQADAMETSAFDPAARDSQADAKEPSAADPTARDSQADAMGTSAFDSAARDSQANSPEAHIPIFSWIHSELTLFPYYKPIPADAHLAICQTMANQLRQETHGTVYLINNPTPFEQTALLPRSAQLTILFMCRFISLKRGDTLLEALRDVNGEWRLLMVGDGPERDAWEARAAEYGLTERVSWSGWQSAPWDFVSEASIFALISDTEGFGLAAVEGLARGIPVITTRCGGILEVIADGYNGFVLPRRDTQGLTALLQALCDNTLSLPTREACRASVAEYEKTRVCARIETALYNILAQKIRR